MKAVIMAGGKGTRLKPYTTVFPKPLMPIDDTPILEIVIRQLKSYGFDDIMLAVGHLSELIRTFFCDGTKQNVRITYFREDRPLGTAGPLASMQTQLNNTFLMMNGDILSTINYSDLLEYHKKSKAIATVALTKRKVNIDYGVVEINDESKIDKKKKKPVIDYLVSMGIYIFEPEVLKYIKPETYLDIPDLIRQLIADGNIVKGYPSDDYWLDIGRPDDYQKAIDEYEKIKDMITKCPN